MTAKEYLQQGYRIDQRINSKIAQVSNLRELATKATATLSDMPGNATPNTHRMEEIIVKIIDLENEINEDIDNLVDLKAEIGAAIDGVKDINQCLVLRYRYIECMTWKQVSATLCIDERTARRWHKKAIDKVVVPEKYKDK